MKNTIELSVTSQEYKNIAIFSSKKGLTVGEFLIKNANELVNDSLYAEYEYSTLLSFLLRDNDTIELERFLEIVDFLIKDEKSLRELEVEFETIKTSNDAYYVEDEQARKDDLKHIEELMKQDKNSIMDMQNYINNVIDDYKKYNSNFDLDKEIIMCRAFINDINS